MNSNLQYLELSDVSFIGEIRWKNKILSSEFLRNFTDRFYFGKSYILNSKPNQGGWALSWIIAGQLQPQEGNLKIYHDKYNEYARHYSWLVGFDSVKRFNLFEQSVETQIKHGLQDTRIAALDTLNDYINYFLLSPPRMNRKLIHVSSEVWRASCAIGVANGRHIICFPGMESSISRLMTEYRVLWFEKIIKRLTDLGCLVIIPVDYKEEYESVCDFVINV